MKLKYSDWLKDKVVENGRKIQTIIDIQAEIDSFDKTNNKGYQYMRLSELQIKKKQIKSDLNLIMNTKGIEVDPAYFQQYVYHTYRKIEAQELLSDYSSSNISSSDSDSDSVKMDKGLKKSIKKLIKTDDIDSSMQLQFWKKYNDDSKFTNREHYKIDPIVGVNGYYEYDDAER